MEDENEFYDDQPAEFAGFCGKILEVMKRPTRKLFPSMDNIIDQ